MHTCVYIYIYINTVCIYIYLKFHRFQGHSACLTHHGTLFLLVCLLSASSGHSQWSSPSRIIQSKAAQSSWFTAHYSLFFVDCYEVAHCCDGTHAQIQYSHTDTTWKSVTVSNNSSFFFCRRAEEKKMSHPKYNQTNWKPHCNWKMMLKCVFGSTLTVSACTSERR